ncbi:hypothetical protein M8Z33_10645 [Streptomyces sp. ZAF1911]|uniref:hypothetical protein n=1 Tax=Streptomyces sp. ZAF1911 TaxID=2944129 RepID=UPI00237A6D6B|nr:hypothetical protein [Streptomyces sp. ZAF1911]MDD9377122.1 hypothetical protein [Streptomyces sp. ZAF1911]
MRKALTFSAIALASSMALAAPAVAFAADATPTAHSSASADAKSAPVALKLSASSGKPGDSLQMSMEVPDGSTNLSISSKALNDVKMTDGRGATATIAKVADGNYGISLTGTGPKGEKLQATAQLTVKDGKPTPTPTPTPSTSTLSLSQDHGKPGEKIQVTVKTAPNEKSAFIKSDAFGGQVNLKNDGKGVWTGTAVVAKDVKTGYYGVDAFAGGKKFDTVKFSTDATGNVTPKPKPAPLDPSHHKTPKGSVNTGQAPLGWVPSDAADNG